MPRRRLFLALTLGIIAAAPLAAEQAADLAGQLRDLNVAVVAPDSDKAKELPKMLGADARNRIRAANQRETQAWKELQTKADWEKYKEPRIAALRASLGQPAEAPKELKTRVTRTLDGDGFKIENVVFESRPGLVVTANVYSPKEPGKAMPGVVVCPSHHNPKTEGELQDMGMTWARQGGVVVVLDSLGHGERRAHPFVDAKSYPGTFRVGRQDYWFRYNTALQLHLVGESLVGWMAWDLSRCVDLLLSRPGVDKNKIILLGAVAGGGDPAAVAAAVDPRIACVVPFNFGGPQPETTFPLPMDAEAAFNYAGGGSWESTRNLRLSARDGFLPWVIVGSAAPRHVIHAHEFAWDKDRDPVWARYQKIFGWYNAGDNIAAANGRGSVSGRPPEATHCNNIGPEHRKGLYPSLNRWFAMTATPENEYKQRHPGADLMCLTKEAETALNSWPLHTVAAALGAQRASAARQQLNALQPDARAAKLRQDWTKLLGDVEPVAAKASPPQTQQLGNVTVERFLLEVDTDVVVPVVILVPKRASGKAPLVVAFSQEGKQAFLKQRAAEVAELLDAGVAVCLPDLRGCGETNPGGGRGRTSNATSLSATEQMLGRTMLGLRLRDLRTVLKSLRARADVDGSKIALWGDSFAAPNADSVRLDVPWDAEKLPAQSEPLGGLLALLGGLYEPDVKAIYGQGGLASWLSIFASQFCYVPHDAAVPGALTTGELGDLAATLAPRPLRLDGLVDGVNRPATAAELTRTYAPTREAYGKSADRLQIADGKGKPSTWLLTQLK